MTVAELLPGWVGWIGPIFYIALLLVWLASFPVMTLWLIRRKIARVEHWTERAELAREGRFVVIVSLPIAVVGSVVLGSLSIGATVGIERRWVLLAGSIISFAVVVWSAWRFARGALRQPAPGFSRFVSLLLRRWWPGLVLFVMALLAPSHVTSWWMVPWTVLAAGWLYSLRYLPEMWVAAGAAHPADERVRSVVEAAARASGRPAPATSILSTHAANAVAFPGRNLIVFTQRLVDELNDEELEAIALHEMAHLNERPAITRKRSLSVLLLLPIVAVKPLVGTGWLVFLIALFASLIIRAMFRRTEIAEEARADHEAVESAHGSTALGTGLLKMHESALIPAFLERDTHGALHDRLERAGVTPDFEHRKARMPLRRIMGTVVLAVAIPVFVAALAWVPLDPWDGSTGSEVAVGIGWNEEQVLWYLGSLQVEDGQFGEAAVFFEAAAGLGYVHAKADLTYALAVVGRCEEAHSALADLKLADPDPGSLESAEAWVEYCHTSSS